MSKIVLTYVLSSIADICRGVSWSFLIAIFCYYFVNPFVIEVKMYGNSLGFFKEREKRRNNKKRFFTFGNHMIETYNSKYNLKFSRLYFLHVAWESLNAATNGKYALFLPMSIIMGVPWHVLIEREGENKVVRVAFTETILHEVGHLEHDIRSTGSLRKKDLKKGSDRIFVSWASEVFSDFFGFRESGFCTDQMIDDVIDKKEYFRKRLTDRSEGEEDDGHLEEHPSWHRRRQWLHKRKFDENLVREIASNVGCADKGLIEAVCKHYPAIDLDAEVPVKPSIHDFCCDSRISK